MRQRAVAPKWTSFALQLDIIVHLGSDLLFYYDSEFHAQYQKMKGKIAEYSKSKRIIKLEEFLAKIEFHFEGETMSRRPQNLEIFEVERIIPWKKTVADLIAEIKDMVRELSLRIIPCSFVSFQKFWNLH